VRRIGLAVRFAPLLSMLAGMLVGSLPLLLLSCTAVAAPPALPEQLHETGLFAAGEPERLGAHVQPFEPRHALWSDGAAKRRWIRLPPGSAIDARDADAWRFPRGTKLWKEFSHAGRVETRYLELGADGQWRFASYAWSTDGRSARLAPAGGLVLAAEGAPDGRYAIPSRADCLACHAGARSPVLGFGALQLGPALPRWVRGGHVRHAPAAWREHAPAEPGATEIERAARGYLHANCAHCHHATGGVPVPLVLAQDVAGNPAPAPAQLHEALRRMSTREPTQQMPPLGTRIPDPAGLALLRAWLDTLPARSTPHPENLR
jgi:mono/diheme cytochrome c family protein